MPAFPSLLCCYGSSALTSSSSERRHPAAAAARPGVKHGSGALELTLRPVAGVLGRRVKGQVVCIGVGVAHPVVCASHLNLPRLAPLGPAPGELAHL